ncbi:MAG: hypothetical protein HYV07_05725 [Deltaproteobacteria bacterium]|nr:hypothetical protein [Deltaproteobacteria bacterium]
MARRLLEPFIALAFVFAGACGDDGGGGISLAEEPKSECIRPEEPHTYEVFFVIDVSGSMSPFLRDVRGELVALADNLPEADADGRRVRVDYYLIAFVNDARMYGGRMTSVVALQSAFDEAIEDGLTNYNLNVRTFNAEEEENLLDALTLALDTNPSAEAKLFFIAADAPFVEAPRVLSESIPVQSKYTDVMQRLGVVGARIHAFTEDQLDGLTRTFHQQPALTTLPGSTVHALEDLRGAREKIRGTLADIAARAACN